jgi:RNA polymerase sigma-70 factor (ECF subfamily)
MNLLHSFHSNPLEKQTKTVSDSDVIARIQKGDTDALEIIMRRYNQRLYRIARSIVRDDHEAMDVLQDTYIKAYDHLHKFRGPNGFIHWLSRITTNEALMRIRKHSRIKYILDDPMYMIPEIESFEQQPLSEVADQQLHKLLEDAIDTLSVNMRSVFVMRAVQQLSTRETALSLNLTEQTVKTRFYRAKRMIRKIFEEHIEKAGLSIHEFAGDRCDFVVLAVLNRLCIRPNKQFNFGDNLLTKLRLS